MRQNKESREDSKILVNIFHWRRVKRQRDEEAATFHICESSPRPESFPPPIGCYLNVDSKRQLTFDTWERMLCLDICWQPRICLGICWQARLCLDICWQAWFIDTNGIIKNEAVNEQFMKSSIRLPPPNLPRAACCRRWSCPPRPAEFPPPCTSCTPAGARWSCRGGLGPQSGCWSGWPGTPGNASWTGQWKHKRHGHQWWK